MYKINYLLLLVQLWKKFLTTFSILLHIRSEPNWIVFLIGIFYFLSILYKNIIFIYLKFSPFLLFVWCFGFSIVYDLDHFIFPFLVVLFNIPNAIINRSYNMGAPKFVYAKCCLLLSCWIFFSFQECSWHGWIRTPWIFLLLTLFNAYGL